MRVRRSPPPLWFVASVAVALAVLGRALWSQASAGPPADGPALDVHYAFWGFLVTIASFIWDAIQGVSDATVAFLTWAVQVLQLGAVKLFNALKAVGNLARVGIGKIWDFSKLIYSDVLKPAWTKFWSWFDKARKWLDDTVGPLLRHLRDLRDATLCFWKTYVRPWLDLVDITRRGLRVLASLGVSWARALDAELGKIEDKIQGPFLYLLGKLNEVINVVNLVVTADGLFQRLTLIRSLARDYQFAWAAITAPYVDTSGDDPNAKIKLPLKDKTIKAISNDIAAWVRDQGGELSPLLSEMTHQWKIYFKK